MRAFQVRKSNLSHAWQPLSRLICFCLFGFGFCTMVAQGTGFDSNAFNKAIRADQVQEVQAMLDQGGERFRVGLYNSVGFFLETAARHASPEMLKLLAGQIGNSSKACFNKALVASIDNPRYEKLVPLLVELGADPAFEDSDSRTALGLVATVSRPGDGRGFAIARLLLDHGAYVDSFDEMGFTPLMHACSHDDLPLAELLLSQGADPDLKNKDSQSARSLAKPGSACARRLEQTGKQGK